MLCISWCFVINVFSGFSSGKETKGLPPDLGKYEKFCLTDRLTDEIPVTFSDCIFMFKLNLFEPFLCREQDARISTLQSEKE